MQCDSIAIHHLLILNKLEADMTPRICRYRELIETGEIFLKFGALILKNAEHY